MTRDSLGFLHWMMTGRRHSTQARKQTASQMGRSDHVPLDTVHAKITTGIHYEERAQCKVHDKKCFQSHPRSRARALRASTVLVTRPPRQMTIMMSMNIWDTHHHGHDALST